MELEISLDELRVLSSVENFLRNHQSRLAILYFIALHSNLQRFLI